MPELNPAPASSEFQKLSANMLQYVFDLEQKVEQSFSVSHVTAAFIVGAGLGFLLAIVL